MVLIKTKKVHFTKWWATWNSSTRVVVKTVGFFLPHWAQLITRKTLFCCLFHSKAEVTILHYWSSAKKDHARLSCVTTIKIKPSGYWYFFITMSRITWLTQYYDQSHLDRLYLGLGYQASGAGSPRVFFNCCRSIPLIFWTLNDKNSATHYSN